MVTLNTRSVPPWYRRRILKEQNGMCANIHCLKTKPLNWKECETNHIIPWNRGGRTIRFNLEVLCITCHKNSTRSDAKQRTKGYLRLSKAEKEMIGTTQTIIRH